MKLQMQMLTAGDWGPVYCISGKRICTVNYVHLKCFEMELPDFSCCGSQKLALKYNFAKISK